MANILLTWELGGGFGHIRQLKPIADLLEKDGHKISWLVKEAEQTRKLLQEEKSFLKKLKKDNIYQAPRLKPPPVKRTYCFTHILQNQGYQDTSIYANHLEQWLNRLDELKPDIVISDFCFTGIIACHIRGIKVLDISNGWTYPSHNKVTGLLVPASQVKKVRRDFITALQTEEKQFLAQINRHITSHGKAAFSTLKTILDSVEDRVFMNFAETDHFGPRDETYLGMNVSTGFLPERTHDIHILMYLMPFPAMPAFFEYIKTLPYQFSIFMTKPAIPESIRQATTQDNIKFYQGAMDFTILHERCDYFVGNGNLGSTTLSLKAGLPVLSIPTDCEKELIADRTRKLGGLMANYGNPENIISAFNLMINNQSLANSAKDFSSKYNDFNFNDSLLEIKRRVDVLL